jgi:hypothetical protein
MQAGLNAVQAALDAAIAPVPFFLRDDDAGWNDARLFALLDCTERAGVPIDLAVIPQAAHGLLAQALCARIDAAPDLLGVHQHGFAHQNFETVERKCEFGNARSIDAQRDDLCAGRERLRHMFEHRLDAIFTPPWNRCSVTTPTLLAELGYVALSRDRSAPAQNALPELRVDVDWCKTRKVDANNIGFALAQRIGMGVSVGLMLHHAEMNSEDLILLNALLRIMTKHSRAQFLLMRELVGSRTTSVVHRATEYQRKCT